MVTVLFIQSLFHCLVYRLTPTNSYVAGTTHISLRWFFESSINLLIFLVFGFRIHLFPDAANSDLRESLAMIVSFFVCVVFSIAVMIACCSALYIEDWWDLILFLIIWLFVTIPKPTLSSFSDPFV
jgi:hypothetical protein